LTLVSGDDLKIIWTKFIWVYFLNAINKFDWSGVSILCKKGYGSLSTCYCF